MKQWFPCVAFGAMAAFASIEAILSQFFLIHSEDALLEARTPDVDVTLLMEELVVVIGAPLDSADTIFSSSALQTRVTKKEKVSIETQKCNKLNKV